MIPDVVLPSRLDGLESGEQYLDYALAWDHIKAADYQRWENSPTNITELQRLSQTRIAMDEDFKEIIVAAEEASARREQTEQSLLLITMLKEREQLQGGDDIMAPHRAMAAKDDDEKEPPTLQEEIADDPYVDEGKILLLNLLAKQG